MSYLIGVVSRILAGPMPGRKALRKILYAPDGAALVGFVKKAHVASCFLLLWRREELCSR
jgi:hypothetical protein